MKNRRRFLNIMVIFGFLCSVGIAGHNLIHNTDFLTANLSQVLTLLISLFIAFWANQQKSDERKKKEHVERILEKIQNVVNSPSFYTVFQSDNEENVKQIYLNTQRVLKNSIEALKKYSDIFMFHEEATYISEQIRQYRDFVSNHFSDIDYLAKSSTELKKYADNISNKCNDIVFKLY